MIRGSISWPLPGPAGACSPFCPEAGAVADLAAEIGNPMRIPISTAAVAALPTTADRGIRMRVGLSPLENPTEYTQPPARSIDEKITSHGPTSGPPTKPPRPPPTPTPGDQP